MRFPFFTPVAPADRGYVHSATFTGIGDPFDPNSIWARPRSMRRDQERLKGMLDNHAFRVGGKRQVLSHVLIELPLADVEDDHRISGGESARNLERELAELHARDLGEKSAAPRYRVCGAIDLADDEVRVCFGHAVFLPDADDRIAWKVDTSTDGAIWSPLAELPENQRVAIVGADRTRVSFGRSDWPFPEVDLIIDNVPGARSLEISAKPRGALAVSENVDLNCLVIEPAGGGVPKLYLRATRLLPSADMPARPPAVPARSAKVHAQIAPHSEVLVRREPSLAVSAPPRIEEGTLLPGTIPTTNSTTDETWVVGILPTRSPALRLAGIALPRLSRFAGYGVRALRFGLDAGGRVLPPGSSACPLRFEARGDDSIWVATRGGERKVAVGEKLPMGDGGIVELRPLPAELAERYVGWMPLPEDGPFVALPDNSTVEAGRSKDLGALRSIQVMSAPGFLDADHDPGADVLGISSRHASFQAESKGLRVHGLGRMPLAILNVDHALVHVLQPGEEWVIQGGQLLVFGHYVWRWESGADQTGAGS